MNDSLVSILFPVYNSSDFARSGGHKLLQKALDSLLAQKYKNIEIIILDNQSTDDTPTICKNYAEKDSRVKYFLDSELRFPEEAISHIAIDLMHGEYCMIANDDDLYHPDYVSEMVKCLESDNDLDMAYSNGYYVDLNGEFNSKIVTKSNNTYGGFSSSISNYCVYIQKRNVLPIIFGLFKSTSFVKLLPFEKFDNLKANVDNLFIALFFIKQYKCFYLDRELFYYRDKIRGLSEVQSSVVISDMPDINKPLLVWLYYVRHQFLFYKKLDGEISCLGLPEVQYNYARCATFYSFIKHSLSLLGWINKSYIRSYNDRSMYHKIVDYSRKNLKTFYRDRLKFGFFENDNPDNTRFQSEVQSQLIDECLKGCSQFLELIQLYYPASSFDISDSGISEELQNFLLKEKIIFQEAKENTDAKCGKHPTIFSNSAFQNRDISQPVNISVISPSLNLGRFLRETIISVQNQSLFSHEHIIIDGASTDETLEVLKAFPDLVVVSEKDSCIADAIRKGLKIARGKYIIVSCVSDGFIDINWLKRCVETLDADRDVSLVWGFPQYLTEDSRLGRVSYPQFHHSLPPVKSGFFIHWLKTSFWLPESNFCVRKEVFDKCFPAYNEFSKNRDSFLEFNYNFNSRGYLSTHIPVVASFGRTHQNQAGQQESSSGLMRTRLNAYKWKIKYYKYMLLLGIKKHSYRDGNHNEIDILDTNITLKDFLIVKSAKLGISLKKRTRFLFKNPV